MSMKWIIVIYTIKINSIGNQTLDPKGGGIIPNKIILPMGEFKTFVLMISPLGNSFIRGGIIYEYPTKMLDNNAHIHYYYMVFCIINHVDYL